MSTLSQEILRLETAKANIDNALISRGIVIPQNAKLDTYDTLINSIKGGTSSEEVTATRANVLAGTTTITSDSNDEIVEGTMIDNGAVTPSALSAGDSYTIPEGYHNGSGIILAKDLASQTQGTATAARIVSGDKAWVNGIQVTGSLAVTSAINFSAATLSASSIRISWTNPTKGAWSGVKIRYSTSGYPGVSGGTLVYTGAGSNASAGGSSYVDITGLIVGATYYFTCYSYATGLGDSAASYNCSAKTSGFLIYNNGIFYNNTKIVSQGKWGNKWYNSGSYLYNAVNSSSASNTQQHIQVETNVAASQYSKIGVYFKYVAHPTGTDYAPTNFKRFLAGMYIKQSSGSFASNASYTNSSINVSAGNTYNTTFSYGLNSSKYQTTGYLRMIFTSIYDTSSTSWGASTHTLNIYRLWLE